MLWTKHSKSCSSKHTCSGRGGRWRQQVPSGACQQAAGGRSHRHQRSPRPSMAEQWQQCHLYCRHHHLPSSPWHHWLLLYSDPLYDTLNVWSAYDEWAEVCLTESEIIITTHIVYQSIKPCIFFTKFTFWISATLTTDSTHTIYWSLRQWQHGTLFIAIFTCHIFSFCRGGYANAILIKAIK